MKFSFVLAIVTSALACAWVACGDPYPAASDDPAMGDYKVPCFDDRTCKAGLVCTQDLCLRPGETLLPDGGMTMAEGGGSEGGGSDGGLDGGLDAPESVTATSCQDAGGPGLTQCGPDGGESCCASLAVTGGTFNRSNEATYPATVSSFKLDRFEVTVGRFRRFVNAVAGGWLPAAGSGKHTHLNGGQGLAATGGGREPGWDSATWNGNLAVSEVDWTNRLSCDATYQTWTASAGANEARPIVCATWFAAYAFCIWDGGFLPSEAEWSYAAAGGSEQRVYPWSKPAASSTINCTFANYGGPPAPCSTGANRVGSDPSGDGKWGQADMAGNVSEWNADEFTSYVTPCNDCANVTAPTYRVVRGGGFLDGTAALRAFERYNIQATYGYHNTGLRCARTP